MGELEYSLITAATSYYRGFLVGKKFPKEQKQFLLFSTLTFTTVIGLVIYKPIAGLLLFVLPMCMGMFMTAWATYEHHAGRSTQDQFHASFNNTNRWYNLFTGNLGYHTAHHYNGGLHWSKLPKLHDKIADKIPPELIRETWV